MMGETPHLAAPDGFALCGRRSSVVTTRLGDAKCQVCKRLRRLMEATQEPLDRTRMKDAGYRIRAPREMTDEEAHELWQLFVLGWDLRRVANSIPGLRVNDLRNRWRALGYPISKYGAYTPPRLRGHLMRDVRVIAEHVEMAPAAAMAASYELARTMEPSDIEKFYRRFLRRHGLVHPEWMPTRKPKTTRFP